MSHLSWFSAWDLLSLLGLVDHSNKYLDDHRIIYGNVRHKIVSASSPRRGNKWFWVDLLT